MFVLIFIDFNFLFSPNMGLHFMKVCMCVLFIYMMVDGFWYWWSKWRVFE